MYALFPVFFFGIFLFIMAILNMYSPSSISTDPNLKKVEQGQMSKVTYNDHTYIVWSINLGGGLVHDPDCKCIRKQE